jgi:hypothetical protein
MSSAERQRAQAYRMTVEPTPFAAWESLCASCVLHAANSNTLCRIAHNSHANVYLVYCATWHLHYAVSWQLLIVNTLLGLPHGCSACTGA